MFDKDALLKIAQQMNTFQSTSMHTSAQGKQWANYGGLHTPVSSPQICHIHTLGHFYKVQQHKPSATFASSVAGILG